MTDYRCSICGEISVMHVRYPDGKHLSACLQHMPARSGDLTWDDEWIAFRTQWEENRITDADLEDASTKVCIVSMCGRDGDFTIYEQPYCKEHFGDRLDWLDRQEPREEDDDKE